MDDNLWCIVRSQQAWMEGSRHASLSCLICVRIAHAVIDVRCMRVFFELMKEHESRDLKR
jgi:hypothetical protein